MLRQARGGCARERARPEPLRCSAPHKSPVGGPVCRALASRAICPSPVENAQLGGGSTRRRAICARPRAQRSGSGARIARASRTDSAPLSDHSERSERREFGAAEPRSEQRGESARRADPGTMSTAAGRDTAARKPCHRTSALYRKPPRAREKRARKTRRALRPGGFLNAAGGRRAAGSISELDDGGRGHRRPAGPGPSCRRSRVPARRQ